MSGTVNPLPAVIPRSIEDKDRGGPRQPLLMVRGLRKAFHLRKGWFGRSQGSLRAVDGVDFEVAKQETLGIVGESGCGKSTVARLLMHLMSKNEGEIVFDGDPVAPVSGIGVAELRRQMQMVFQDSFASLNPRMTIEENLTFGLRSQRVQARAATGKAHEILDLVGLSPATFAQRYPHELSGGQRQRVNIARALIMSPRLVILDESVSALDKSVEAQVLNLLRSLKQSLGLTYIFISHDLNVVRYISDRVMVMYLGKVVEVGAVDELFDRPLHPYTRALLDSRPSMNPAERRVRVALKGDPPNPIDPPSGCRFRTRCPIADSVCEREEPALEAAEAAHAHQVACFALKPQSGHRLAQQQEVLQA